MSKTDTSEKGLETLIVASLTGLTPKPVQEGTVCEAPVPYAGAGWIPGKALARVMTAVLKDDTELFKQFSDNDSFRRWLTDRVFDMTYTQPQLG